MKAHALKLLVLLFVLFQFTGCDKLKYLKPQESIHVPNPDPSDTAPIDGQVIVKFSPTASPALIDKTIAELSLEATVYQCDCKSKLLLLEYPTGPISPEERRKAVTDKLPQEGDGSPIGQAFLNLPIQLQPIPDPVKFGTPINPPPSGTGKNKVTVSVIDAGIPWNDPIFSGKMWINEDSAKCEDGNAHGFDFSAKYAPLSNELHRHGSFVGGIIAKFPPEIQLQIMDLRIFDYAGNSSIYDVLCAINFSIENGADVINMSWGYYFPTYDTLLLEAFTEIRAAGVSVITSAGNAGLDTDTFPHFPSGFTEDVYGLDNIISVAALNTTGTDLAHYSNRGISSVDIAAQGTDTLLVNGVISEIEGTSFAAPMVTRTVSYIIGNDPTRDGVDCVIENPKLLPIALPVKTKGVLSERDAVNACP